MEAHVPLVKICGVTEPDLLPFLVAQGVRYVGAIYYPKSPRHNTVANLQALRIACPAELKRVLVTVNADDVLLDELITAFDPHLLQLHGDETPARVLELKTRTALPVIKAIAIAGAADIERAKEYEEVADFLLFDTKKPGLRGGTGEVFDWSLLKQASFSGSWFLSGGLGPKNIAQAIAQTNAPIVDISSGVESSAGIKDRQQIEQLMQKR